MIIQNFNFFDKFGKNLNLDLDSTGSFWKGVIYFPELSTYLYDNENKKININLEDEIIKKTLVK